MKKASLLATENLFYRLLGYSIFGALVFGIRLWRFYLTGDWVGTLKDTVSSLGAIAPIWDLPALALMLRWPAELPLPEQLPMFVSVGLIGVESLQKVWRWASKRVGLALHDELLWRLEPNCCGMRRKKHDPPNEAPMDETRKTMLQKRKASPKSAGAKIVV